MAWLTLNFSLTLGRPEKDQGEPDWSPQGTDALVELSGAPERPQMGFCPPSDPMRREVEVDE